MDMEARDGKVAYMSVDIEASGPIPGEYSMLSVGACVVGDTGNGFYVELSPISDRFVQKAIDVCKLDLDTLKAEGTEPEEAMRNFAGWVEQAANRRKAVFVGFNAGFDWSFVNYYFVRFLGKNPFGVSCVDIKSVWMGQKNCEWAATSKAAIKRALGINVPHTHNALDDAREQAAIFERMLGQ